LSWASLAAWWRQPSDNRRWIRSNPLGLDDRLPELVRVAGLWLRRQSAAVWQQACLAAFEPTAPQPHPT
jgi:hypothetical protein